MTKCESICYSEEDFVNILDEIFEECLEICNRGIKEDKMSNLMLKAFFLMYKVKLLEKMEEGN